MTIEHRVEQTPPHGRTVGHWSEWRPVRFLADWLVSLHLDVGDVVTLERRGEVDDPHPASQWRRTR